MTSFDLVVDGTVQEKMALIAFKKTQVYLVGSRSVSVRRGCIEAQSSRSPCTRTIETWAADADVESAHQTWSWAKRGKPAAVSVGV